MIFKNYHDKVRKIGEGKINMKKSALLIVFIIQLLIITVLIMDYNDLLPSYTQSNFDKNVIHTKLGKNVKYDTQRVVLDNISITLREYVYSKVTKSGVCMFAVKGLAAEELESFRAQKNAVFGSGLRLLYGDAGSGTVEQEVVNNTLMICYRFVSTDDGKTPYSDMILVQQDTKVLGQFYLDDCDSNGHEIIEGLKVSSSSAFLSKKLQCHSLKLVFEEGEKVIVANSESMTLGNGESEESKRIWFDEIYNNKKIKAVVFNGKYFEI